MGVCSLSWPGSTLPNPSTMVTPVTLVATTPRQRRERRCPSGSSRNGRVMASTTMGAHRNSPATAASRAASGNGRWSRTNWSTQGSRGIANDPTRPEAA